MSFGFVQRLYKVAKTRLLRERLYEVRQTNLNDCYKNNTCKKKTFEQTVNKKKLMSGSIIEDLDGKSKCYYFLKRED